MRAPRRVPRLPLAATVVAGVLLLPVAVAAQETPLAPLPGEMPEPVEPPLWMFLITVAIALLAAAVILAVIGGYVYLSRRFFAREEPPPPRRPVRFAAGMGTPPPSRVSHPVQEAPRAAPPAAPPARPASSPASAGPGGAPATPAAERPAGEKPAAVAGEAPAQAGERPAPAAEEKPAAPARHAPGSSELDQETFERVLKEQLEKGINPRVAEGRARAAAVKAAREKAGAS